MSKYSSEQLLQFFKEKHGDKYTYPPNLSEYRMTKDKIPLTCPVKDHGVFYQDIKSHVRGQGCPKCGQLRQVQSHAVNRETWIIRFEAVHGKGTYDYSKFPEDPRASKEFPIYCPTHDLIFHQSPNRHVYIKHGCPKCGVIKRSERKKESIIARKDFIQRSQTKNGPGYEYINLPKEFSLNDTLGIFCLAHNKLFFCKGSEHLGGKGCPVCVSEKSLD